MATKVVQAAQGIPPSSPAATPATTTTVATPTSAPSKTTTVATPASSAPAKQSLAKKIEAVSTSKSLAKKIESSTPKGGTFDILGSIMKDMTK